MALRGLASYRASQGDHQAALESLTEAERDFLVVAAGLLERLATEEY